ncbi:MAG: helix-turn-helix domain-containing protein [Ktedonobacteraceae bacterium]|nr:helix-turn-helix domain-containing protein [Ktedonobacteraceae bacterium]
MTPRNTTLDRSGAEENTVDYGKELLTVREVARQLRVDTTTVRRWIKTGALDAVALPHRGKRQGYRVKKQTIDSLLASTTTTNQAK